MLPNFFEIKANAEPYREKNLIMQIAFREVKAKSHMGISSEYI